MSEHHSAPPASLCSWPPSITLLYLHLFARGLVVLTGIVGISLLFAVSVRWDVYHRDAAVVGGSFLIVSVVLTAFIIVWNARLLKRVKKIRAKQQQSQDVDSAPPRFKTTALKIITFLEGLGALSFFIVFIPVIDGASRGQVAYAYGSVSILCAAVIHLFLFATHALQLHSAGFINSGKKMVCPHCNHAIARVSTSSYFRTPPESITADHGDNMLVDSLVDSRIGMNPGQETGTTYKTPRQSEHQNRAPAPASPEGEANETGEGEQDALIAKSG